MGVDGNIHASFAALLCQTLETDKYFRLQKVLWNRNQPLRRQPYIFNMWNVHQLRNKRLQRRYRRIGNVTPADYHVAHGWSHTQILKDLFVAVFLRYLKLQ